MAGSWEEMMKPQTKHVSNPLAVTQYMTRAPHTIGENVSLDKALKIFRELNIRHLPVRLAGSLVGVISDRDIRFALSIHPSAKDLKIGDIMTEDPYAVSESTPVSIVAAHMAQHKIGSA